MSEQKNDKEILDSDADGLLDEEEMALGTDPNNKDTDKDGLDDYQEVKLYKTNPLDPDTDKDRINDGTEVKMGRNPRGQGSLRDLFIPHEGNDYKPRALHPKRLAFHAITAIVIKVIMVGFAVSLPVQAWLSPDILYEQAQKIVKLTNDLRADLGLNTLKENVILNQAALNKAEDMLIDQYFAHVSPDNRALRHWLYDVDYNFKVAGENLAIGFSNPETVMAAWQKSPTHYSNIIDPDFTEIGVGVVSGEYNGYDTTLIAQYFGDPYTAAAPVTVEPIQVKPIEVEVKESIEVKQDYNSKVKQAVDNFVEPVNEQPQVPEKDVVEEENDLVLAEKEAVVLAKPVLISPVNNYVSKEDLNVLTILAQGAERIAVYVNNQIAASKILDKEQFDIALKLAEGNNQIQIIAYQSEKSINSDFYSLTVDKTPPILDQSKTSILVNKPSDSDDFVLKATAYLSDETNSATVFFANQEIALSRDYSQDGKWTGYQIVSGIDYESLFNPLTLATLMAKDVAGNTLTQDIKWEEIKPVTGSTINRYSFLKQANPQATAPLFDLGNIYYKIMLGVAIIALTLNIFIKIKKQHASTIASTVGFIALIIFLTIL